MIITHALTKWFNGFAAVDAFSLHVRAGEVVVLLGPNGAGKTTTVRMLSAVLKPTSGRATVVGFDTVHDARAVRQHVGVLTETPGLYLRMTPLPYLDFFGQLWGLSPRQRAERSELLLRRFDLWEVRNQRLAEYSKGMKQKLTICCALIHDPKILLLDEPLIGIDPRGARTLKDMVLNRAAQGKSVIISSHMLYLVEELCNSIIIIDHGKKIAEGSLEEIRRVALASSDASLEEVFLKITEER